MMGLGPIFDYTKKRNWVKAYFDFDITDYKIMPGEARAWDLFHFTSRHVPAYKDFLKKHGVNPAKIKNFSEIPVTDKKNYIQMYPLKSRVWDPAQLIAASSGTSGEPTYWPRGGYQEFEQAVTHEYIYRMYFEIHKLKTLLLIGFPMGTYVSGVATLIPSWLVAQKYPNLTIASVGNNKSQMLQIIKSQGNTFDQIILVGHPFFIKDILETGKKQGIRLADHRIRMMFCSEGFNEDWRNYVANIAGVKQPKKHMINTYGSSELLLIGHETPDTAGYQYNPFSRFAESVNGELVFTAFSGAPLVRYNLHDAGSIERNIITLRGRSDYAVIFYAANIYPEHIRTALNRKSWYKKLTGKFIMEKTYLRNKDEILTIHVELCMGVKESRTLATEIKDAIIAKLLSINMEYQFLWNHLEKDIKPRVMLEPYQKPTYFPLGLKPRYIL